MLLLSLIAVGAPASETDVDHARRVVGPPSGPPLAGAALDAETQRVALLLRCPVCQGLSVADSPSAMALNMRAQVRELIASGFGEEQVLRYFERSYGEFVRLRPPLRGVNWIVWLAPIVGLLLGAGVVSRVLRRRSAAATADEPAPGDDTDLDPYLRRVRETAYGWPGGVRPEQPVS